MKTIEELLSEVKAKGFNVTQWHERMSYPPSPLGSVAVGGPDAWWCEIRNARGFRDSDTGATAQEALHEALQRAKGLKGAENRPLHLSAAPAAQKTPKTDVLDDLDGEDDLAELD